MSKLLLALALAVLLIAMLAIFLHRRSVRQVMQRMEHMLDAAMDGSFRESAFDETQLSRLESKLARYLTANEVSADHLASERDKIRTLISDISHQTKTPIANLRLYTELLQEESLPNSAAQAVTQLQRQTEKLSFLITSLVKLSRLETGILTVHPEPHPLDTLLADLAEQYTPAAAAKGLAFSVADAAGVTAVFDKKWVREAVGNLIDNAIKYTKTGSVRVSVQPYELFTCIHVTDTGIGISESEQAAIFRRFYRSAAVQEQSGVGIGLFLSREIVSLQGGYIRVRSVPGGGSTFSLYLPASPANLSKL